MTWIESHDSLPTHPKTGRLSRLLSVSVPAVMGHLHLLWYWAAEHVENGDLNGYDANDLAFAMQWTGDAEKLEESLIAAGFLDRTPDGGRTIHNWDKYIGKLLAGRRKEAERMRSRRAPNVTSTSTVRTPYVGGNNTIQHNTTPDSTEEEAAAAAREDEASPEVPPIREVLDAWTHATGMTVTAQVADSMQDWCDRLPRDWILDAIRETGAQGVRSWKYANTILARWEQEGREVEKPDELAPRRSEVRYDDEQLRFINVGRAKRGLPAMLANGQTVSVGETG